MSRIRVVSQYCSVGGFHQVTEVSPENEHIQSTQKTQLRSIPSSAEGHLCPKHLLAPTAVGQGVVG